MSKSNIFLNAYKSILMAKSAKEVYSEMKQIGLTRSKETKEEAITKLIQNLANNENLLNRLINKYENKEKEKITETEQKEANIQFENHKEFDWNEFREVTSLQNKIIMNYSISLGGKVLWKELKNEMAANKFKKFTIEWNKRNNEELKEKEKVPKPKLNKIKEAKVLNEEEDEANKRESNEDKAVQEQQKKLKSFYLEDDTINKEKEINESESELLKYLKDCNIQWEIVFPHYIAFKKHDFEFNEIRNDLIIEDMANFNKYWEDQLDRKLKPLVQFNKKKRVTSVLNAEFILGLIKETEYNKTEAVVKVIDNVMNEIELKQSEINMFLEEYEKYPEHSNSILLSLDMDATCKLIQAVLEKCEKENYSVQMESNFKLRILNVFMKLMKEMIKNIKEIDSTSETTKLLLKSIFLWLQIAHSKENSYLDDLKIKLDGLIEIDQISEILESHSLSLLAIYEHEWYENIVRDLFEYTEEIFINDDIIANVFEAEILNSVITNFYEVFKDDDLSQEIVVGLIKRATKISKELSMSSKKSLLKLATSRPVMNECFELAKNLLNPLIGLDLKETLLAIQFAITYSVENKEGTIKNLIVLNLSRESIDPKIKSYVLKITNEQIKDPLIKKEIEEYLNE